MNKAKIIKKPNIARELLKRGYTIKDIKPDKRDNTRTVFVFNYTDGLDEALREAIEISYERRRNRLNI